MGRGLPAGRNHAKQILVMKTTKLTKYTPIPTVVEYVRRIVENHNSGNLFPVALSDICQLFFSGSECSFKYICSTFNQEKDYVIRGNDLYLSAECLRKLFLLYSYSRNEVIV